jgi:Endoglucanase
VTPGTGFRGLTPKEIVKDMFLGWNLGNTFDSTSGGETGWGNPVTTQAMIDTVKSGGFKTVRIPVTWQSHLGAAPSYTIDKTWLDRVETVVNYVLKDGMYAIVNTHHDGWYQLSTAAQAQGVAETTAVWGQIATRFRDYSDYLILETFNEPHGTVNAYSGGNAEQQTVLNAYHLAAVNAIRATGGNNAQRIIMIPPHGASPYAAGVKALVIPNNDPNIIISLHTYYPTGFGLNGSPTTWGASASEYTAMGASLDQILGWFPDRAVVIGEWGSVSKDDLASRVKHAKAYTQDATKRGMCPVWWDNGGGDFGLLNRKANPPSWTYPTVVAALKEGSTAGSAPGATDATMP